MGKTHYRPAKGSQAERLLIAMLHGRIISAYEALYYHNVSIPAARCAELRRMGWPIRTVEVAHPNAAQFPTEKLTAYFVDAHFREWYGDPSNLGKPPSEYPFKEGRGKFEDWTTEEFAQGEQTYE